MINEPTLQTPSPMEQHNDSPLVQLPPGGIALEEVERELVRQAMERSHGNQTHAAELLGIERDALRRRLIKFGLLHREPHTHRGRS